MESIPVSLCCMWFIYQIAWWRHQMETFSALLTICAGNWSASDEFPAQRPVTQSFDVFFDLCLNKRLRRQSWGWWFETLSRPLWRYSNGMRDCLVLILPNIVNPNLFIWGFFICHWLKRFIFFDYFISPSTKDDIFCKPSFPYRNI